jgi:hypothetical protein
MEDDLEKLKNLIRDFGAKFQKTVATWKSRMHAIKTHGRRAVLWGSGSKPVSFSTTLGIKNEISFVVDINPHKHGFYMPGTDQQIVPPKFLKKYRPDIVIVMNPIYYREIQEDLRNMGLNPEIITL